MADRSEKLATWIGLFIGTGLELGITKEEMLRALAPHKLDRIIDVLAEPDEPKPPMGGRDAKPGFPQQLHAERDGSKA